MYALKKAAWTLLAIAALLLAAGCGEPRESLDSVKQKVVDHLAAKGYKADEFDIQVEYHATGKSKYGGPYAINVTFHDEANVIYNYKYDDRSENETVTQSGVAPLNGKNDKNFKHAE